MWYQDNLGALLSGLRERCDQPRYKVRLRLRTGANGAKHVELLLNADDENMAGMIAFAWAKETYSVKADCVEVWENENVSVLLD